MCTHEILKLIAERDPNFTVGEDRNLRDLVRNDKVYNNESIKGMNAHEFCNIDSRFKTFCTFIANDPSVTHLELKPSDNIGIFGYYQEGWEHYEHWLYAHLFDAILKSRSIKHLVLKHKKILDFDANCFQKLLQIIRKPSLTTLGLDGITDRRAAYRSDAQEHSFWGQQMLPFWSAIKDNPSLTNLDFSDCTLGISFSPAEPRSEAHKNEIIRSHALDLKVMFEGITAKKKLNSLNLRNTNLHLLIDTSFEELCNALKCVYGSLDLSSNDFSNRDGTPRLNLQQLFDAIIAGGLNSLDLTGTSLGQLNDASLLQICDFIKGAPLKPCPLTHLELPRGVMLWYSWEDDSFRRNIWEKFVEAIKASSICSMPGLKLDEIKELSDKDRSDFDAILTHNRFKQALASADAVVSRKPVEVGGKDKEGNYIKESLSVPIAKTILSMLNIPNMREHNLKLVDAVSNRRVTKKATYGEQKKDEEDVESRADFKASRESVSAAVSEALDSVTSTSESVSASLDRVASTGESVSASLDSVASTGKSVSASLDSVASTGTNDFSACQSTSSSSQSTSSTLGQEIPRCGL